MQHYCLSSKHSGIGPYTTIGTYRVPKFHLAFCIFVTEGKKIVINVLNKTRERGLVRLGNSRAAP